MRVRATVNLPGQRRGQEYDVNGRDKIVKRRLAAGFYVRVEKGKA